MPTKKKTVKKKTSKCLTCGGSGYEEAEVPCVDCNKKGNK